MKRHARGIAFALGIILAAGAAEPGFAGDAQGRGILWRKSYYEAAQEAARTNKPMLMQVTATWCGACQSMFSQTLSDSAVIERINSSFIPFQIDADRHAELISALRVQAYPTTLVIDSDLTILTRLSGFQGSGSFRESLAAAARKSAERNRSTAQAEPASGARPVKLDESGSQPEKSPAEHSTSFFTEANLVALALRFLQAL